MMKVVKTNIEQPENPINPLFPVRASKVETIVDYPFILQKAWEGYDASKTIKDIADISAMVSTNHVFRITFEDGDMVIAKLSYFGKYEHFKEDHPVSYTHLRAHETGRNL